MRRIVLVVGMLLAVGCAPTPECVGAPPVFISCGEGCTAICLRPGFSFPECQEQEPGCGLDDWDGSPGCELLREADERGNETYRGVPAPCPEELDLTCACF